MGEEPDTGNPPDGFLCQATNQPFADLKKKKKRKKEKKRKRKKAEYKAALGKSEKK